LIQQQLVLQFSKTFRETAILSSLSSSGLSKQRFTSFMILCHDHARISSKSDEWTRLFVLL